MEDQELAQTLKELERKLSEIEDTLRAIGSAAPAPYAPAAPTPPSAPASTPPSSALSAASTAPPAPSAAPGSTPAAPSNAEGWSPAPAGADHGRIVDESLEGTTIAQEPPRSAAPVARTAPPPRGASSRPVDPRPSPPPPAAPRRPAVGAAAPVELLRFRERLEHSAREITHEYDELLGRLSYAAMPTAAGPTISFARGVPSLDIIDVEGLRDAAVRAFESDPEGATAYGTAVGYQRLRAWIADRHGVEPERVLVTNGSLQADAFLFDHLLKVGDEVVVESPTYDRTLLSLRERGTLVHSVALDTDGIETHALAELLQGGVRPKLAHVIPNFQNPAGYTLSLERRHALLSLASQHRFLILEDDPYVELRFTGEQLPTMLSIDGEHVVYASSFTKTVCPGVRVGYLVGPPELIAGIAKKATNTYISPGMVSEAIVYEFAASGALERSIETVKNALQERAQTLGEALREELPEAEFVPPQGGYFMWVTLPPGTSVDRLFDAAAERGVAFVKGSDFLLAGGENALRLAYSGVTPEQIRIGVARLAEAYRSIA